MGRITAVSHLLNLVYNVWQAKTGIMLKSIRY